MDYMDSEYFSYKNNELYCENIPLKELSKLYGTPLYVYSKNFMRDRYSEFTSAFESVNHKIFFAAKSNFNLNVMKLFYDLGSGIDVNSVGELYRALKIGADPKRMLLTGVGKTKDEIKLGLEHDVLMIKAESLEEVYQINKIAGEMGKVAPVAIRVNPDVDPQTHPYISTGLAENKFGIDSSKALEMFLECSSLSNINLCGIDMHIGSQITSLDPYVEAVIKMTELTKKIISRGIKIEHFDIGGGFGIKYLNEVPFTPAELADALIPIFKQLDCEIFFEPGRFLTANGGALITEVLYTKSNNAKNFIVVDAAMTDLLRPSIYKAYHHIQPVEKNMEEEIVADVVGPVCESGDFLGKDRTITGCKANDLLAVMSAGAYGMVMASNYNARRRPPEVIVDKDKIFLARSRETFEHLLYDEKIIDELHA
ncbi:MAG: diaminopimelate decarboxylase [Bacteroidetes bacterium]|nr:diaminopimelate decarboxylase [Bacteroidota bacterium]